MSSILFTVPLLPPSVNHYKTPRRGGGWFVSKEAQAFIEAVAMLCPKERLTETLYQVRINYRMPGRNLYRTDLDNLLKVSLDALTHAGVIKDDRYVVYIQAYKFAAERREDEGTQFTITGV